MNQKYVNDILDDNLIDKDTFNKNPGAVKVIECFHFSLPPDPIFTNFPGLVEIRIIEQDVKDLSWLKDLPNLEKLQVFHTLVNNTQGLSHCPLLKRLILEGNKLEQFPDISELPNLEYLSVAQNPIGDINEFPVNKSLKNLNIAQIGLSKLSDTIENLENLELLNVSANNIHTFSVFDTVALLENLKEVDFYDPQYGANPICDLPNYSTISVCNLENIETLDTYKITKRYRSISQNRIQEVGFFYSMLANSEIANLEKNKRIFIDEINSTVEQIRSNNDVTTEVFSEITNIYREYQNSFREIRALTAELPKITKEVGGTISTQIITEGHEEWSDFLTKLPGIVSAGSLSLTALWEVNHLQAKASLENKEITKKVTFQVFNSSEELIDTLKTWTEVNHKCLDRLDVNDSRCLAVMSEMAEDIPIPVYILFLSRSHHQLLKEARGLIRGGSLKEVNDTETLVLCRKSFDCFDTMTSITLIECGINSLSRFQGLINLHTLRLPFNELTSIADLPNLPALTVLDVSFNKIADVGALVPVQKSVCDQIKEFYFIGNPVFSPIVAEFAMNVFPSIVEDPPSVLFASKDMQESYIPSVVPESTPLDSITYIDLSGNCLMTLRHLAELPQLEILIANDNRLTEFDLESPTLTTADVSSNMITRMPNPKGLPQLKTLSMNNNKLAQLSSIPTLLELYVVGNQIAVVPASDFFPTIISLSISHNPIAEKTEAHRFLYQFKTLKVFNGKPIKVSHHSKAQNSLNGILFAEDLPSVLKPGQTLLDLSDRGYKDVNVISSSTIQRLILANNQISEIKWPKGAFPVLTALSLSGNTITDFDFLNDLPNLMALDLSSNKLNDELLKNLVSIRFPNLRTLILSKNSFRTLIQFPGASFPRLESLSLARNFINTVPRECFTSLKLTTLDISFNSLKKLDSIATPTLISLDVSHNRITSVDEVEKLRGCTSITKFFFNDNPLNQRTNPRIRCLVILRGLTEMDGRPVTESDLAQARIIIDQMTGGMGGAVPPQVQPPPGRAARVTNVIIQPQLPMLHEAPMAKRKAQDKMGRFPR